MELGMVHWRWFHALVNIEPGLDEQDCYNENFGFSRAYATSVVNEGGSGSGSGSGGEGDNFVYLFCELGFATLPNMFGA